MRIAIASGKGGTGKTTLATHLAVAAARLGHRVRLVDCDVEAPNCHLFLEATWTRRSDALTYVPRIDQAGCTLCGTPTFFHFFSLSPQSALVASLSAG